jgi:hypothetical protein
MADPIKQCPYDAVTWDGADRVSSSGELLSPAQQLAAVGRQYLQHLAQLDEDLPTNVEGAWCQYTKKLMPILMHCLRHRSDWMVDDDPQSKCTSAVQQ